MTTKLELTWPGKNDLSSLSPEPRILIEAPELSNTAHDPATPNMLIHGDNLLALKALEQDFAGKVKCIYIDPPYNTGAAFEHYDDNFEHSTWLNLMRPRLELLRKLLADDGFFCCEIDDSEGAYLKVMLDEIFGRNNYLTTIYIRVRYSDKTLKQDMAFHKEIEQLHIYRKSYTAKPILKDVDVGYEKFNYKIETTKPASKVIELGGKKVEIYDKDAYKIFKEEGSEYGLKEIWASGTILDGNSSGRFFRDYLTGRAEDDGYGVLYKVYGIGDDRYDYRFFTGPNKLGATKGKYYQGVPLDKINAGTMNKKLPIYGFWDLAASFGNCRLEGGVDFRSGKKPEVLLKMLLEYFSNPGDLVLDSFLGSGTTAAVAHKMGRHYIGVEIGDHVYTHCKTRLDKVIAGEDQGGITKSVGWTSGGGYRFYELAPTLINTDEYGQATINKAYDEEMLAKAVALHEGFTYEPDETLFWKQSKGSEKSYLYVTSNFVSREIVEAIHGTMNDDEYLIIACKNYDSGIKVPNITIKKIPQSVLGRCEFEKNDYNLNITNPAESCFDFDEIDEDINDNNAETPDTNILKDDKQMSLDFEKDD